MMKNEAATALIALVLLGGCSSEADSVERVKEAVRAQLKDPYSAQFTDIKTLDTPTGITVCGEVNAKNSFGAYSGSVKFWGVAAEQGPASGFIIGEGDRTLCDMHDEAEENVDAELAAKRKAAADH